MNRVDVIIYDDREDDELDEPIPYAIEPADLPAFREGLHFVPDDEYGYGT